MGPETEALHVALSIVRVNLQARHTHLARLCQRQIYHEWAATVANDYVAWLAAAIALPLDTPAALSILQVPVSHGGLGFLSPQCEGAFHYLQAFLALAGERADTAEEAFHRSLADTLSYLSHQTSSDLAAAVPHPRLENQGVVLRTQTQQMQDVCPWLVPPPLPRPVDADIFWKGACNAR